MSMIKLLIGLCWWTADALSIKAVRSKQLCTMARCPYQLDKIMGTSFLMYKTVKSCVCVQTLQCVAVYNRMQIRFVVCLIYAACSIIHHTNLLVITSSSTFSVIEVQTLLDDDHTETDQRTADQSYWWYSLPSLSFDSLFLAVVL